MNNNWKYIVWIWLLVPVLLTGCIKEDMEDCDNVAIRFRYDADGDVNVLRQYIDKIDLYVFDEKRRLVEVIAFDGNELSGDGNVAPRFKLAAGKYTVVAVGNPYDRTTTEGVNSADFSRMFIQHPAWGTAAGTITGHDHSYMGQKEIVVPAEGRSLDETVWLYSSHIDVYVEIHGLPAADSSTRGVVPCRLSFENSNAQTDFNNEINAGQMETAVPDLAYNAEKSIWHTGDFALFRMDKRGTLAADLCRHTLNLEDADGNMLAQFSIADYLEKYRDVIDVTLQEAYLPICIRFTPLGVSIEIPSWYVEDIEPDWTK